MILDPPEPQEDDTKSASKSYRGETPAFSPESLDLEENTDAPPNTFQGPSVSFIRNELSPDLNNKLRWKEREAARKEKNSRPPSKNRPSHGEFPILQQASTTDTSSTSSGKVAVPSLGATDADAREANDIQRKEVREHVSVELGGNNHSDGIGVTVGTEDHAQELPVAQEVIWTGFTGDDGPPSNNYHKDACWVRRGKLLIVVLVLAVGGIILGVIFGTGSNPPGGSTDPPGVSTDPPETLGVGSTTTKLGAWAFCDSNSQCENNCCSTQYSTSDGKFKCTPNGTICTGSSTR